MGHDHDHDHHPHPAPGHGRAFLIGVVLNLGFVIVESVYGVLSHSMALVADAGHNLGDVAGLALAWGAASLSKQGPSVRRTYGLRKTTIVASLANSALLLLVTGGIIWESIQRLARPAIVAGPTVIVVALVGVVINAFSALLFLSGRKEDLNVRAAFLHLASDAVLALGVAVSGAVILFTRWMWLDPLVSILLALVILRASWRVVKESLDLVLDAVPEGIDPAAVKAFLETLTGVCEVHDLHIWAMSTSHTALTAHLVMRESKPAFLGDVCKELHKRFKIEHATLQVDSIDAAAPCRLAPDDKI
ncbi:MAG: cation diffusion facilitator family transporter [Polyangiaceae bacterium]